MVCFKNIYSRIWIDRYTAGQTVLSLSVLCHLQAETANQNSELEALRAQLVRLQAEKNDLVAMNSELQLKTGQGSEDDSFIEIRFAVSDTHLLHPFIL